MRNRVYKRYTKRMAYEFGFGDRVFKAFSNNISERGVFLKTKNCLVKDSPITLTVHLPDGVKTIVKGVVRWAVRSNSPLVTSGMGIEVLSYDNAYHEFLKGLIDKFLSPPLLISKEEVREPEKEKKKQTEADFLIFKCSNCGVKNKVRIDRLQEEPKCGKCKEVLRGPITNF